MPQILTKHFAHEGTSGATRATALKRCRNIGNMARRGSSHVTLSIAIATCTLGIAEMPLRKPAVPAHACEQDRRQNAWPGRSVQS